MTRRRLPYFPVLCFEYILPLLVTFGCGKRQMVDHPPAEVPPVSPYEIIWVEPQIVISDSFYTLIKAERIDSFYVGQTAARSLTVAPSVRFHVTDDECFTSVNLLGPTGEVTMPLLARNLSRGFYKLTVDFSRLTGGYYPAGHFYLKAEYCASTISQPIRPLK